MANGRLTGDCVKQQKAGAELINVIKSSALLTKRTGS